VNWSAFEHCGKTYDLAHLKSCTLRYERPAQGNKGNEIYLVDVVYTLHCFSREPKPDECYDKNLIYSDGHEDRLFDFRRFEMSKLLPEIVQGLPERKPFHNANRRNFFTVEVVAENGQRVEYDIFFKVKKKSKGRLEMIVETAFIRDPEYCATRPAGKPVRFWIILHNTLNNIRIRT
jgi:hypothetical protein